MTEQHAVLVLAGLVVSAGFVCALIGSWIERRQR